MVHDSYLPSYKIFQNLWIFALSFDALLPQRSLWLGRNSSLLNKLALINEDGKQYIISIRKWFKTKHMYLYMYMHAIMVPNYLLSLHNFWWIFSFLWMGYGFRSSMGAFNITTTISTSHNNDNDTAMKQQQSNSNHHETTRRNTSFQNTWHDWGPRGPKEKQEENKKQKDILQNPPIMSPIIMIYKQTLNILNNKGVATCPGMASSAGKVSYPKHISRGQGTLRMVNAQAAAEIQRARISLLGDHLGFQEFCWKFWAQASPCCTSTQLSTKNYPESWDSFNKPVRLRHW